MAQYQTRGARLDYTAANAGGAQGLPRVAGLRDGGFAVTWIGADNDRTSLDGDVFARVFSANLTPTSGQALQLITDTGPTNSYPVNEAVTSLQNGGFAVFSTDDANYSVADAGTHQDVALRFYDANGTATAQPLYLGAAAPFGVTATTLANGEIVAGWIDPTGTLRAEYVSAAGTPLGQSFAIAQPAGDAAVRPTFASLVDGGWAATYVAQQSETASAVFYDAQGNIAASHVVATNLTNIKGVEMYGLADDRVVMVWGQLVPGQQFETHAQIYSADGTAYGGEQVLSTTASSVVSVTGLADGGFAVAFEPQRDGSLELKTYSSIGQQTGSTVSISGAFDPSVAPLSDGGFTLTWRDATQQFHTQAYSATPAGDQSLNGTANGDAIVGQEGNDTISGLAGDDSLYGSVGNDHLYGNDGNDYLDGGAGNDILEGGNGNDVLVGGIGGDILLGAIGGDILYGQGGDDYLSGGDGDDYLDGGTGADVIHGDDGADHLMGGDGRDILYGDAGRDYLVGGNDGDILIGGLDGDIHIGGAGDDYVNGQDGDDYASGGTGADVLVGEAGNDQLFGDDGRDQLQGGDGNDYLDGGNDGDILYGDAGDDILLGRAGDDYLVGGDGNDYIHGGDGVDVLLGQGGNDIMLGGDGNDFLYGGDGNDQLQGGSGGDVLRGEAGDDVLVGEGDDDALIGGDGNDYLIGGPGNDYLEGGNGNDIFLIQSGDGGADRIADFVVSGPAADIVRLTGFGWTSFADVQAHASQQGTDTVIDFGAGQTLTMVNVALASLSANDFQFG